MTQPVTRSLPSSTRPALWLLSAALALVLLAGCASQAPRVSSTPTPGVEPLTASDEPASVRRARLRYELAANYFDQGQTTVALDEIKLALAADANYGPAYVLRGLVYMRLNDGVLAEESFRRALQINPQDADAQYHYALFHCENGRYERADQLLDQAIANPTYRNRTQAHFLKGWCLLRAGKLDESEAALSKAYEFAPNNPMIAYNLASLKHRRGDSQGAQFIIRRVNNSELANAETLWLGIRVERRLGNDVAVAQLAQQLSRRFGDSPQWAAYQRGAFND